MFFTERKKHQLQEEARLSKLEKEEEARQVKMQETSYFQSQPSNQLSLFKSRKMERVGFTKTISNGNSFKITKRRDSNSPVKRTTSLASSSSPERTQKSIHSVAEIPLQYRKVIYISEHNNYYPEPSNREEEKNFVLATTELPFKRAETITVLPSCTYDIFYQMAEGLHCKRLYLETTDR